MLEEGFCGQKDLGQRRTDLGHSQNTARPGSEMGRPRSLTADRTIWVRDRKTYVTEVSNLGQRQEDLGHSHSHVTADRKTWVRDGKTMIIHR